MMTSIMELDYNVLDVVIQLGESQTMLQPTKRAVVRGVGTCIYLGPTPYTVEEDTDNLGNVT
jgi:hypothetical protein